ncbi:Glycosyltransferase involved in cell wall bisynthesis [Salinimicrobium sediminis]|uniref:Glycosyltransferase involved in cell wall bisynthesis n=1 Tax=Salinimicrobium sediminis TaxID=1343891 RepID=A0A285X1E4_9FLAO|nr:glycosyltransferase family 4 protein [Salinimicrobium sediminis]SOC78554.1 Glycosyltransferase involved in cell wall bisynthesis [Salinimicrobium sediminis]
MKILFLFTYNKGLLSDFFMDLGQQLIEDGHEVKVYSLKEHPGRYKVGSIEIIVEKKGGYGSDYFRIFRSINEISPDVIISNFSYANPSMLAGKILKIKRNIVWVHSLKKHGDPGHYVIMIKRQFYKLADKIIVNSCILEKELKEVFHVKGSKIIPIPFWSNIQEVKPNLIAIGETSDQFLIGCPGRFTIIKNQQVIITALASAKANASKELKFYLAGDGPNRKNLEMQVSKLNLGEEVNFLGVLSAGQMVDFYKKMDLIVLPSLFESFGLVFIEALSLGIPVLVSDRFGALDFVNKENKDVKEILFDPEDPEALANKISDIVGQKRIDRDFYKTLYTEHFKKEKIYREVLDVLIE